MTTALILGRFQPFHHGHLFLVKQALEEADKVIIAIGSSQESNTTENPFSIDERIDMIHETLKAEGIKKELYRFVSVPDIFNYGKWVQHVEEHAEFDIVFCNSDITKRLFKEKGYIVHKVPRKVGVSATMIRQRIANSTNNWQDLVPKPVLEFLIKIKAEDKLRKITKLENIE